MALLKSLPPNIDKKTFKNCTLLFLVLCFLIYGKSIGNSFAMDDEFVTLNNPQIQRGISAIPEIFRTTYAIGEKASYEYRPLVKVTYAIEYQLFGENPYLSHFINILMYVASLIFLFYLLLRLLPTYHYIFSLLVVLLFLVHPLHSEVIMSLKNRDVIMSFTAGMVSLFFYLKYAEGKSKWNLAGGSFFMLVAFLSKRDAMPFYAIIPFTLWFFKNINWKKILVILTSFIPVPVIFGVAVVSVQNTVVRKMIEWENPLFFDTTIWDRIPQGFYSIWFYIKMFFVPYPLISYYGYDQVPIVGWDSPIVWLVIIFLLVAAYFVVKNFKSRPVWLYGFLYFLITISMFTNVVKPVVGIVGERFAFIASLGLCISAAYFILKYLKIPLNKPQIKTGTLNNKLWFITGAVVLVFGIQVFARNAAWKDAYTLYKTDAATATESAHTHSLLAASAISKLRQSPKLNVKEKQELIREAEEHYREALRIIPNYISSLNNLGMVYYTYMNNAEKAIPFLEKAVKLDPNYVEAYYNLATCYAATKRYDESEKNYLRSLEINPNFVNSYTSLSNVYAYNKQFDKIISLNQAAIDKGIKHDAPYINIANVYFMRGDTLKSLPYLEKAIAINGNNRTLNSFLANYYKTKGDMKKSSYYFDLMAKSPK